MAIYALLLFHRGESLEREEEENTEARGYLCRCVFCCNISFFLLSVNKSFVNLNHGSNKTVSLHVLIRSCGYL